ncbi:hypothetical protein [Vibrio anguillarum]|nr:hypothetical protein [Vibrio anguillarum]
MAKQFFFGLSLSDTPFVEFYGDYMSPNWALIVYYYTLIFKAFGAEEQILPLFNIFLFSYLFFFFQYLFKSIEITRRYLFSLGMLLLPGPIYWVATLSKEGIFYCFMAFITYLITRGAKKFGIVKVINVVFLSVAFSLTSRFNIVLITILGIFSKRYISGSVRSFSFIYSFIFITFITLFSFSFGVFLLSIMFGFDYLSSPWYIPLSIDADSSWGYKMRFVADNIVDMWFFFPVKFILTVFSEVNPIYFITFPYFEADSYAIIFSTAQGVVRIISFFLLFCFFPRISIQRGDIRFLLVLSFINYLVFAVVIGFFQSRYLIFSDYLLVSTLILLFYSKGNNKGEVCNRYG